MKFFVFPCSRRKFLHLFLIVVGISVIHHIFSLMFGISKTVKKAKNPVWIKHSKQTKRILLWDDFYLIWYRNKSVFPKINCPIKNCVFFMNRNPYNVRPSYFDAIIFPPKNLTREFRPSVRTRSQIYIFTSLTSSRMAPVCDEFNDNFFNWTLTYRLDSHIPWTYFFIRNSFGNIVAPSLDVAWEDNYLHTSTPIKPALKRILSRKTKAAVWIVTFCPSKSFIEDYLLLLQTVLVYFSLKIDLFGECSDKKCPNNDCSKLIKENYFFYMAYENSILEDYVTEKVMDGYENFAVPIVYGGANYSRFLPPGSYVNAKDVNPYTLALIIYKAVSNRTYYEQYFKWKNHYTVEASPRDYHPLCDLCAALHTNFAKNAPAIKNFRKWWMGKDGLKWCLPEHHEDDDEWKSTSKVNTTIAAVAKHIYRNLYRKFKTRISNSTPNKNATVT